MSEKFELKKPEGGRKWAPLGPQIFRLEPRYYGLLSKLKAESGLPYWDIIGQCIDFAVSNRGNRD